MCDIATKDVKLQTARSHSPGPPLSRLRVLLVRVQVAALHLKFGTAEITARTAAVQYCKFILNELNKLFFSLFFFHMMAKTHTHTDESMCSSCLDWKQSFQTSIDSSL